MNKDRKVTITKPPRTDNRPATANKDPTKKAKFKQLELQAPFPGGKIAEAKFLLTNLELFLSTPYTDVTTPATPRVWDKQQTSLKKIKHNLLHGENYGYTQAWITLSQIADQLHLPGVSKDSHKKDLTLLYDTTKTLIPIPDNGAATMKTETKTSTEPDDTSHDTINLLGEDKESEDTKLPATPHENPMEHQKMPANIQALIQRTVTDELTKQMETLRHLEQQIKENIITTLQQYENKVIANIEARMTTERTQFTEDLALKVTASIDTIHDAKVNAENKLKQEINEHMDKAKQQWKQEVNKKSTDEIKNEIAAILSETENEWKDNLDKIASIQAPRLERSLRRRFFEITEEQEEDVTSRIHKQMMNYDNKIESLIDDATTRCQQLVDQTDMALRANIENDMQEIRTLGNSTLQELEARAGQLKQSIRTTTPPTPVTPLRTPIKNPYGGNIPRIRGGGTEIEDITSIPEHKEDHERETTDITRQLNKFKGEAINFHISDKPGKEEIEAFYRTISYHLSTNGIPIRSLQDLEPGSTALPADAHNEYTAKQIQLFALTIYHKLTAIVPPTATLISAIVYQHLDTEDGYATLYEIMRSALPELQDLPAKWGPPLTPQQTIHQWTGTLQQFISKERRRDRDYQEWEITANIIQHAIEDRRYELQASMVKARLLTIPRDCELPHELRIKGLPNTIAAYTTIPYDGPTPTIHKFNSNTGAPPNRPRSRVQKQCPMCMGWGHDPEQQICFASAQTYWAVKYMTDQPDQAKANAEAFKVKNTKKIVNMLSKRGVDIDDMHDPELRNFTQLAKLMSAAAHQDSIQSDSDDSQEEDDHQPIIHKMVGQYSLQPLTIVPGISDDHLHDIAEQPIHHHVVRKLEPMKLCLRRYLQGDSGANTGATDKLDHLWNFHWYEKPIPITIFKDDDAEEQLMALGEGTIKMISDQNDIMSWRIMYTPGSGGAVLSPQKFMMDNPSIDKWNQWGTRHGRGQMQFHDAHNIPVHTVNMEERNGLWFTTNSILIPDEPTLRPTIHTTSLDPTAPVTPSQKPPAATKVKPTKTKDFHQLEIWHQRYGHPGTRILQQTQKTVEGMPPIPDGAPLFKCRFCDMAKQKKKARGPPNPHPIQHPGQRFHMDLGFIRGPNNLQAVVTLGAAPGPTVAKSRHGFVTYLCIIDAKTRYLWTFPLTSRHAPIELVDSFLHKHGRARHIVTTSPNGLLAKSQAFHRSCNNAGYTITPTDWVEPTPPGSHTIRTDEGELGTSQDFRDTIDKHGYMLELTGPDSSSQNGLGERPHRTLADKVRCLLYTAGLGIEFWADALIHSTWLYNRTFHSALKHTPYEAFTGVKPTVDMLLTFGCRLTPKRPHSQRPTKGDTNSYHGIFLGYTATNDNMRYYDIHTQREKTAHHGTYDEFQYGDAPGDRSPASRHIIETITGDKHELHRTDIIHDTPTKVLVDDNAPAPDLQQLVLDSTPPVYTATAAKFERPDVDTLIRDIQQFEISLDPYYHTVTEHVPLKGDHPTLGLIVAAHPDQNNTLILENCLSGTPSAKIRTWRSRLRHSTVLRINDILICSLEHLKQLILHHRQHNHATIKIDFATLIPHGHNSQGIPQLHFDQMHIIAHHLHAIKYNEDLWLDKSKPPPIHPRTLTDAIMKGMTTPKLTRRKVMQTPEKDKWRTQEWSQLNKYQKQQMFGNPCPRPPDADTIVLPFVWTYLYKIDPLTLEEVEKARGTCNGGKRYGKAVTLAETYAACVEQPAQRLYWSIIATLGMVALGTDVANAFAEAPPPEQPFFMMIDDQFRDWWENCLGLPPIPKGHVLPVLKNLQGHPEAPRLWHKHIHSILTTKMHFRSTTHEPCLYFRYLNNVLQLVLRQVDDFSIGAQNLDIAQQIREEIQSHVQNPLNDMGLIQRFNGVDILQARDFVRISCETYIIRIVETHGWEKEHAATMPVPMKQDTAYHAQLELTLGPEDPFEQDQLQHAMGFSYRQCIGELIFAMTVCRIDIALPTIKLSQYSARPAKIHYQAVKHIFIYLYATRSEGLYYWRAESVDSLPNHPHPIPMSELSKLAPYPELAGPHELLGGIDTTWAACRRTRKSVTGNAFLLGGAAIFYRCRYQATLALSSTEAEFDGHVDSGKTALYLRSILEELGLEQKLPTVIHADNKGAIHMSTAHQPTRRTRHVDIKSFAVLQWTEEDLIRFDKIASAYNLSDSLTKMTGRYRFWEHMDILMGRRRPAYTKSSTGTTICTLQLGSACNYLHFDNSAVTSMGG